VEADEALYDARARVLHDLCAAGCDNAHAVDLVDDALSRRRWWVEQWPEGAAYVAGLVAQDVQEAMLDVAGRCWPDCPRHDDDHELRVEPDLGADPRWVCERDGSTVARLGHL
jgi:hypothetical protein